MALYFVFLALFAFVMVCFGLLVAASAIFKPLKEVFPYLWRAWLWSFIFVVTSTAVLWSVASFAVPYVADRSGYNVLSDAVAAKVLGVFLMGPAYTVIGGLILGAGFGVLLGHRTIQKSRTENISSALSPNNPLDRSRP
jgi:hypothetical protein